MKHFHQTIEGWFHHETLISLLVSSLPRVGGIWIEVGTWKGKSAAFTGVEIINQCKRAQLHLIDTWKGSGEAEHEEDPDIQAGTLLERCRENLKPLGELPIYTVSPSVEAAKTFADGSLDVVYLDAAHDYENVLADLNAWAEKVAPGGYMAGDDMEWPGVRKAVMEYFEGRKDWTLSLHIPPSGYAAWVAKKNPHKAG